MMAAIRAKLVSYWNRTNVRARVLLLFLVGSTIPIVVSQIWSFKHYKDGIETQVVDEAYRDVTIHASSINESLCAYKRSVSVLANSLEITEYGSLAILGKNTVETKQNISIKDWENIVQNSFLKIMKTDDAYLELRYVDKSGQELIRVDRLSGEITIIETENLQNISNNYYIQEAQDLKKQQVYISRMDLKREGSPPEISRPIIPNIRFISPVFLQSGEHVGFIVANVSAQNIFKTLEAHKSVLGLFTDESFVVDKNGFYLKNNDESKVYGGPTDLNTGNKLHNDHLKVAKKILSGESGALASGNNLIAYAPIFPYKESKENFWVVTEIAPKDDVLGAVKSLEKTLTTITLFFVGVLALLSFIVSEVARLAMDEVKQDIEQNQQKKEQTRGLTA